MGLGLRVVSTCLSHSSKSWLLQKCLAESIFQPFRVLGHLEADYSTYYALNPKTPNHSASLEAMVQPQSGEVQIQAEPFSQGCARLRTGLLDHGV